MPTQRALIEEILERFGQTYAEEIGIRLKNTPAPLFQLLAAALLLSARISAGNAVRAARALLDAGLTTPRKMAAASWQDRVDVLTSHGYKRYDESTSAMLGESAELLLDRYAGDMRQLRAEADRDVAVMTDRLQQFKGIGPVGADIFLREVQGIWREVYPFVDARVAKSARRLDLPGKPSDLAKLANRKDFSRLVAGLVRVDLEKAQPSLKNRGTK